MNRSLETSLPQSPEKTAKLSATDWETAESLLAQARKFGNKSPDLAYLYAMVCKKLRKNGEAAKVLQEMADKDANVHLQLGLLSFQQKDWPRAIEQFENALAKEETSFPASYNLMLCYLLTGELGKTLEILPRVLELCANEKHKQTLIYLNYLIQRTAARSFRPGSQKVAPQPMTNAELKTSYDSLLHMDDQHETQLLDLIRGIGPFEVTFPLFQTLSGIRTESSRLQSQFLEMVLIKAKEHVDRAEWTDAEKILQPLTRGLEKESELSNQVSKNNRIAFCNLSGIVACMLQNFDHAARMFSLALRIGGNNAWLLQNLALTYELMGRWDQAEITWNNYFEVLDASVPGMQNHSQREKLSYMALSRLSDLYSKQENWKPALSYLQKAARILPRDLDTLERLFNLYVQLRMFEDARRTLQTMRQLRPNEPQHDLYELDLQEIRSLEDIDQMVSDIKHILNKYPGDARVEERALNMVANCVPIIGKQCDRLSDKLAHIVDQVRRLPSYQINWPVVHDEMHFLRREFQKLKRLSNKCLGLVAAEEHRRVIRDLNDHIDQKIEICISMGG